MNSRYTIVFMLVASPKILAGEVITFDDITPRPGNQIPAGYHGLVFSGSPYYGIIEASGSALPGVRNGVVSGPNVLLSDPQYLSIGAFHSETGAVYTLN